MTPPSAPSEGTKSLLPLVALSCLLFAYTSVRAYVLPITWDEAHNYLEFTRKGILSPFHLPPFAIAANNHFLNSWLTYLTTTLLGVSEFSLRLPVLAAHLVFLYYTARLSHEMASPLLRASAFVVLNVNPYVLDFFSLSRGYGLAYCLLAGSLWYLYRFFHAGRRARYGGASIGFGIAAVTAHLTLIHFLIVLCIVILLAEILLDPTDRDLARRVAAALKRHSLAGAMVCVFLAATVVVIGELRRAGAFYYGGTTSFWSDTIVSIVDASLYDRPYLAWVSSNLAVPPLPLGDVVGGLALLTLLIALSLSINHLTRRNESGWLYLPALVFLLCACSLVSVAQHHVLGVPYLTRRTGLYLWILFAFVLVVLADEMARDQKAGQYWLPVAALLAAMHLAGCLNLRYVLEWKEQADMKEMVRDLALLRPDPPAGKFNTEVGVSLEFEAPLNFYRLVDRLTWLNVADRRMKFRPVNDLYLYTGDDWQNVDADSFAVLKSYPLTGGRLLRRRSRPSRYEIMVDRKLDFDAYSGTGSGRTDRRHPRSGEIEYQIDLATLPAETSVVTTRAMVWMQSLRNANATLFVAFERNKRPYYWYQTAVRDGAVGVRTWFPVYLTCVMPKDVQQGDVVSVYLWNEKSPVFIDDLEMRSLRPVD